MNPGVHEGCDARRAPAVEFGTEEGLPLTESWDGGGVSKGAKEERVAGALATRAGRAEQVYLGKWSRLGRPRPTRAGRTSCCACSTVCVVSTNLGLCWLRGPNVRQRSDAPAIHVCRVAARLFSEEVSRGAPDLSVTSGEMAIHVGLQA